MVGCGEAELQSPERPNVILIMADDLGWGDVGYNGNTLIQTPHLDQMAREGVRFDRFYSASAVSSPTRASVLTGRNPYRTGIFHANVGILRPEEITIAELLAEEGYATGHFGKWHLGTLTATERDANRGRVGNTRFLNPPALHGYSEAFVTESAVPTWNPMKMPKERRADGKNLTHWDASQAATEWDNFGTHYWDIDGQKVSDNLEGDDSRVIMDRVIPFIEQQTSQGKNFLAVVWLHAPHLPCVAGGHYAELYRDQPLEMRNYAGCITAMDDQIGRLRAELKRLGVDENTMVWFCSDNGPEGGVGTTGGLRERKRSLHEGGVRVPGIMVWPAGVNDPFATSFPAVTSDYFPTIVDAVGIDPSKVSYQLDGISLLPMLRGEDALREEPIVTCLDGQISLTTSEDKIYSLSSKSRLERYDIPNDRGEANGVKITTDDPAYLKMVERLESYKRSFEGEEYGSQSLERTKQKWRSPL